MLPGWAKGAAQLTSWLIWGPQIGDDGQLVTLYETPLAIAGLLLCGAILTAGPVIYETVEKIQMVLVSLVMVMVIALTIWLVKDRPDAVIAQATSTATLGAPDFIPPPEAAIPPMMLLGALAFAGAGGTTNLGESNYVKDKGYGMGRWIGRITSPITGQAEAVESIGNNFPHTEENLARWRIWWRRACTEHFLSFFCTCLICLVLLTLVSYVLFFDSNGERVVDAKKYNDDDILFIWGEAEILANEIGRYCKLLFLVMGVVILLTTEFGVLDVTSRISSDIVKTAWLRDSRAFSASTLYYIFLWGTILVGCGILLLPYFGVGTKALDLLIASAALNGLVMFLYSITLLILNTQRLTGEVRPRLWRVGVLWWSILFFGVFAVWAVYDRVGKIIDELSGG